MKTASVPVLGTRGKPFPQSLLPCLGAFQVLESKGPLGPRPLTPAFPSGTAKLAGEGAAGAAPGGGAAAQGHWLCSARTATSPGHGVHRALPPSKPRDSAGTGGAASNSKGSRAKSGCVCPRPLPRVRHGVWAAAGRKPGSTLPHLLWPGSRDGWGGRGRLSVPRQGRLGPCCSLPELRAQLEERLERPAQWADRHTLPIPGQPHASFPQRGAGTRLDFVAWQRCHLQLLGHRKQQLRGVLWATSHGQHGLASQWAIMDTVLAAGQQG